MPDLPPEEFRRAGHELVDWITDYLSHIGDYPVLPKCQPGEIAASLPTSAPVNGEPIDRILADFRSQIVPNLNHWNHTRFHGYFSVSASEPGILGEMLAAALNVNAMVWKSCPAATELEQVVMRWLGEWLNLPEDWFGIIYDTASISTMHALLCARQYVDPESRTRGAEPNLTVYTSEQAHSSVEKSAIALGYGQDNVRKIPVDDQFRMRPEKLYEAMRQDTIAGRRPACIVPTIGTTSTSSVDPVAEVVALAQEHDAWVHVDASYAGVTAMLPEMSQYFDGVSDAHSIVVNPHKWLFTPIDLSAFYTARPDILRGALSLVPEYLKTAEDDRALNYMDYSVALGRRFRALKLWFVMRSFGKEGASAILRTHLQWAQELAQLLQADGRFELAAPVPFSLVCFRMKASDEENRALMDRVNAGGTAFLSHTVLRGRFVLRLAIGNVKTSREDVLKTWEAILKEAAKIQVAAS